MNSPCPVIHFEMPFSDKERMTSFYERAFAWQMQSLGEDMGNYVLAATSETENGVPETPGTINGGFYPNKPDGPAQHPSVVIAVENIENAMRSVIDAGGKVISEPMDIPNIGRYVGFVDTEGNRLSMLQPSQTDTGCGVM